VNQASTVTIRWGIREGGMNAEDKREGGMNAEDKVISMSIHRMGLPFGDTAQTEGQEMSQI